MGASTKKISTAPAGSDQLRGGIVDYLQKQGFDKIGAQSTGPVSVAPWQATDLNRSQIRDVTGERTQSVDQLGGANSEFFKNMVGQLTPAFDTQRQLAAAAGKEASGNLTGSAFANRLGSNLGRTLGDQQALLADYATRGLGMEVQRQGADADRILRGDISNQGADQSFINSLLQGRGLDLGARGQDIGVATGNADRMSSENQANANRYLQLLMQQGQPFPDAVVQSGGAGALLGPLAQGLGGYLGGGGSLGAIGSGITGALGKIFGGGGGTPSLAGSPSVGITPSMGNPGYGGQMPNIGGNLMLPGPLQNGMSQLGGGPAINQLMPGEWDHGQLGGSGLGGILGQIIGQQQTGQGGIGGILGSIMNQQQGGGQGGIGSILASILGGSGGSGILGKVGGLGTMAGGIGQLAHGGFNASNIGGVLGGLAGNAIPIPVLGPMLGSLLGRGVGGVAGKVGGGIKHLLGKLF